MRRRGFLLLIALIDATSAYAQLGGGSWQNLAPMPFARQEMPTAVLQGKIYVIGGYDSAGRSTNTVQVYNPVANSWTMAQGIPLANNHCGAAVAAGKLYTFGGLSNQTFVYNSDANAWVAVAPMRYQHGNTAAVGVVANKIYVAGGTQGSTSLSQLEVYDPATNTWTTLAPMSVPRNHAAGAVINGKFYVVGGRGSSLASYNVLEVYDPQTNKWSMRAPMPTARSGIAAAAVNGKLWVFGGETSSLHGQVEVYDPVSNTWSRLPPMAAPRHGIWAAVIGNRIYLPGGGADQGYAATTHNDVFIVARTATFSNISSRAKVETGDNVAIAGFIIRGSSSKRIIVRALGRTLPIADTLPNPTLELHNSSGRLIAANDNWTTAPNRQEIFDSGFAPPQPSEAAILTRLDPGNYTAIARGLNATSGIALVEVYDLETGSDSKLANISTRAFVQTGDNVLIGGIIIGGTTPLRLIVRAIGPSLPVAGALGNPTLNLYNGNGQLLGSNDNWRSAQQAEIIATRLAPSNDLDSAMVRTFPPGNYTSVVRGAADTTGIALVEAYDLQ